MLLRVALVGVVALAVGIASWFAVQQFWPGGGGDNPGAAAEIVGGGGSPPYYVEPLRLVPGDYVPPWANPEAIERGLAAATLEKQKPQFTGTVGEFRVYGFEQAIGDPAVEKKRCMVGKFPPAADLKFSYLPPGTFARSPQFAGVCPDGSAAFVMQSFITGHTSFDVLYEPGERAFGHDASAERVSAATIASRPAVMIRPLTEEGFGRSWVAVTTDGGFIVVDARDFPLSETIKIAEGVECTGC
jgi:hypothetical protein